MKTIPVRIIIPLVAVAMAVAMYSAVHADSISFGTSFWVTSNWSNTTSPIRGAQASSNNDGIICPGGAIQTGWRISQDSANAATPYSGSEYGTQCRQPSLAVTTGARTWVTSNWSNSTTPTYGAKASPNDGISCPAGSVQTGWGIVAIDPGMGVYEYGTQCQPLVSSVTLGSPYWVTSNSSSGSTPTGARASSNEGITCPNGSVQTGWRIIHTGSNDAYAPEGSGGGYDSYEYGTQCRPISATPVEPPPSSCNVVQSYTTPGTYTYTVPSGAVTVTVKGAGGGGGGKGDDIRPGSAGRQSSFGNTVVARGGSGGNVSTYTASPGAPGTASGGDTNTTGGGASGGSGGTLASAATGGNGGMSVKTYQAGALTSPITVVVGAGGAGGATVNPSYSGGNGSSGSVVISTGTNSCNTAPTCSVSFDQNPLTGANTTMRWASTGADLFYINNVGWVGASGFAQVSQTGDYSGTVTGANGTASCPATLSGPNSCNNGTLPCTPATGNLQNACGETTTCPYGCSTQTNRCHTTCQPRNVCNADGTKVVNSCTGAVVKDCSRTGQMCVAGQCISPPIGFEEFDATNVSGNTFRATGHLQVAPSLVKKGDTTRVFWNVAHAASCTVLGSNGDGALGSGTGIWNMFFSGVTGKTTSAIMAKTTYTLLCRSLEGATPQTVQETATVNVLPSFQEL